MQLDLGPGSISAAPRQPSLLQGSEDEPSSQSDTSAAALGINGCAMHVISTFQVIFANMGILGSSYKHALGRVHQNVFRWIIYMKTTKSSATLLLSRPPGVYVLLSSKTPALPLVSAVVYLFPLATCSNCFCPCHVHFLTCDAPASQTGVKARGTAESPELL